MQLSEFQNLFAKVLLTPSDNQTLPASLPLRQTGQEREERIAIYRNNVFSGLISALADIYPTVEKIVGNAMFQQLARKYFSKNPPGDAAMVKLGADFPAFLIPLPICETLPYLQDMALLDLMYHRSHHAPASSIISADDLMSYDPVELGRKQVKLKASSSFLSSSYAIFDIWQLNHSTTPPDTVDMNTAQDVVVTRNDFRVEIIKVDKMVTTFLKALRKGASLEEALSRAIDNEASASHLIQFLLENRLIGGLV